MVKYLDQLPRCLLLTEFKKETSANDQWKTPERKPGVADPFDIAPGGAPRVTADVQSTKLKSMLAGLKSTS